MAAIGQDLALDFHFQPPQARLQRAGTVVQADARQRQRRRRFQPRQSVRRFGGNALQHARLFAQADEQLGTPQSCSELTITSRPWLKICISRRAMTCGDQAGSE